MEVFKNKYKGDKKIFLTVSNTKKVFNDYFFAFLKTGNNSITVNTNVPKYMNWTTWLYSDDNLKNIIELEPPSVTKIVNGGTGQWSYIYSEFETITIDGTGTSLSAIACVENTTIKDIRFINPSALSISELTKCKSLEIFIKSGDGNIYASLNPLSSLNNLKYIHSDRVNATYDTLVCPSLKHLYITYNNSIPNPSISYIKDNLPNLESLIIDSNISNLDFIKDTNIKYIECLVGNSQYRLILDLATILTGKLHQFRFNRLSSLSYSGGGIFPTIIEPSEYSNNGIIFQFPPTTVPTIANSNQVAQLIIDFANQVTTINLPAPLRMITGRTPTASYTDASQPIYKTYASAKAYLISLGVSITNT